MDSNDSAEIYIDKNTHIFFTEISDPDTNRKNLLKVNDLVNQFQQIPCINHPKYILKTTRELISQNLQGIPNLIVPLTIRIAPLSPDQIIESIEASGLEFPVIIRECGTHHGVSVNLLKNADHVRQLYALALDGRDYYLIQLYEYKEDGVYKKYRIVVVDGELFIRSLIIGNHWLVHRSKAQYFMENHPQFNQEEVNTLKNFEFSLKERIEPIIREIHQRIQLDYFGIDCSIDKQGQICLFEANASMNVLDVLQAWGSSLNIWKEPIEKIKNAVIEMLIMKSNKT